jgi:hypothetical protein
MLGIIIKSGDSGTVSRSEEVEKYVNVRNNNAGIVPSTLEVIDQIRVQMLEKLNIGI